MKSADYSDGIDMQNLPINYKATSKSRYVIGLPSASPVLIDGFLGTMS